MKYFDLCGAWEVRKVQESAAIPASVPGCIHADLLAAGKIEDPYYRDNEARLMWIGETDWVYRRTFDAPAELLNEGRIYLRCDGLDTLSTITLNGVNIGATNNQFRIWEFDVKSALRAGENVIEICFASTIPYIQAEQQKRYLNLTGLGADPLHGQHRINGSNHIRKSQCNYGWDWGPMCVTAGIWRQIGLIAFSAGRITEMQITQDHSQKGAVQLRVRAAVETAAPVAFRASMTAMFAGEIVAETTADVRNNSVEAILTIGNPQLWWPNGLGGQPLYDITLDLLNGETVVDAQKKTIGLRTLVLDRHPDQWGESFQFVVNGVPYFAKGANWIPADTFVTRVTPEFYEYLISSAAQANMNMLRVWGGGIYEDDVFYDLCDRYGITIWQDLMFACSAYPGANKEFIANVQAELADNVKRMRHHPCIAFWCGNNELEHIHAWFLSDEPKQGYMTWDEYKQMFDVDIPAVVLKHDQERAYWPSSSHSPVGDRKDPNNPRCGDAHLWEVWHGRQPFEWYRTCEHRFNSEFGFQSFPEPRVVASYTLPEERNITNYMMEWHQRSGIGNDAIIQYMLSWFQLPTNFDMLLWLSQVLQGIGMKYAVEHWRRSRPRGMGTLYWQINDCWPVASWSSIDSYGNWKALHYMARDFFAPLLLSAIEDPQHGTVEVHVTSDRREDASGQVRWTLSDADGKVLAQNTLDCSRFAAGADTKVCLLQFKDHLKEYGSRKLIVCLELQVNGEIVADNLVTFTRPKHLELRDPELAASVQEETPGVFGVTISAKRPALWVWPELEGRRASYSDRFFHLFPGKPAVVRIQPAEPMTLAAFQQALRLYSLTDTYRQA